MSAHSWVWSLRQSVSHNGQILELVESNVAIGAMLRSFANQGDLNKDTTMARWSYNTP